MQPKAVELHMVRTGLAGAVLSGELKDQSPAKDARCETAMGLDCGSWPRKCLPTSGETAGIIMLRLNDFLLSHSGSNEMGLRQADLAPGGVKGCFIWAEPMSGLNRMTEHRSDNRPWAIRRTGGPIH